MSKLILQTQDAGQTYIVANWPTSGFIQSLLKRCKKIENVGIVHSLHCNNTTAAATWPLKSCTCSGHLSLKWLNGRILFD